MVLHFIAELILAIVTIEAGSTFWQFSKRSRFLKAVLSNERLLREIIDPIALESLARTSAIFTTKKANGYVEFAIKIVSLIEADEFSQQRPRNVFGAIVFVAIVAGYFLGPIYAAINLGLFLLSGLGSIWKVAEVNAAGHVLALGSVVYEWHMLNAEECARWIQRAWSLQPLHRAVTFAAASIECHTRNVTNATFLQHNGAQPECISA